MIVLLKSLHFQNENFDNAKSKWLNILNGLSVNIGFPDLEKLSTSRRDLKSFLEKSREKIDSRNFINDIKKFSTVDFSLDGINLSATPNEWLLANDIKILAFIDPIKFKTKLFEVTEFDIQDRQYQFIRSSRGGFFMMSLHLSPTYFIGIGPLDSLFNLSSFSHELGHSTTHKEKSLEKYFLDYPDEQNEEILVSDEYDSYLYEKYFLENVDVLMNAFDISLSKDLATLLLKRKAIQNNTHILKNRMNYLFYSGVSLNEINKIFLRDIRIIYPGYSEATEFDWLGYATLEKPLSRIGYIKAYLSVFANEDV